MKFSSFPKKQFSIYVVEHIIHFYNYLINRHNIKTQVRRVICTHSNILEWYEILTFRFLEGHCITIGMSFLCRSLQLQLCQHTLVLTDKKLYKSQKLYSCEFILSQLWRIPSWETKTKETFQRQTFPRFLLSMSKFYDILPQHYTSDHILELETLYVLFLNPMCTLFGSLSFLFDILNHTGTDGQTNNLLNQLVQTYSSFILKGYLVSKCKRKYLNISVVILYFFSHEPSEI